MGSSATSILKMDDLTRDGVDASLKTASTPPQRIYDEFRSVVDIFEDKELQFDIPIIGSTDNDEKMWENIYLAVRLLTHCNGDIRIYTNSLDDTIYGHNTVLAHLNRWLKNNPTLKVRILLNTDERYKQSRFYKRLSDSIRANRIGLRVLDVDKTSEHNIRGALFGQKAFKFSDDAGEYPVYLANLNNPDVVKPLIQYFDHLFENKELTREVKNVRRPLIESTKNIFTKGKQTEKERDQDVSDYSNFIGVLRSTISSTGERNVLLPSTFSSFISEYE